MTTPSLTGYGLVPSPPAEPPSVGLIPSLSGPYLVDDSGQRDSDGSEIRWEGGVRYNPEQTCLSSGAQDPCSPSLTTIAANPGVVEAQPSLIWAGDKCSTFGWEARDYQARATRALLAVESKQIAHELWTGTQAKASSWPNRYLASPLSDTLSNGPMSPINALACLEQGLGDCSTGARGVIHCTRQLGTIWAEQGNVFRSVGGLIQTFMNTIIIPDAGYDGSGPDAQPAVSGSQWAYATLMPTVRRGPIEVYPGTLEEAVTRPTNDVEFRSERLAVASFPLCCHLAVEVDVTKCLTAGAS